MQHHLIAGNWKMNGLKADGLALAQGLRSRLESAKPLSCPQVLVCPPATLTSLVCETLKGSPISVGGQDCHPEEKGAHTGDTSARMLADAGCAYVILGHSERRQNHGEKDALVHAKALAAHKAGLIPIVCVGETQMQRDKGHAFEVVKQQIQNSIPSPLSAGRLVVAYEPVWAIGTGRIATTQDIKDMHTQLRQWLSQHLKGGENVRLLYGGSVKPQSAREILNTPNVEGVLVGGASLNFDDFWGIITSDPGYKVG